MTATQDIAKIFSKAGIQHPLEPLTTQEIAETVAIIQIERNLTNVRFATVFLNEPSKKEVINFKTGDAINREAFVILLDNATGVVCEVVVSLDKKAITAWKEIPGVQPPVMLDEFVECEAAVKASLEFQEAIKKI